MITLNGLIVLAVFTLLGYWLARYIPRFKGIRSSTMFTVGLILVALASYVGVSTRLVSFLGVEVMLNLVLQGLLLGILIRFVRERR